MGSPNAFCVSQSEEFARLDRTGLLQNASEEIKRLRWALAWLTLLICVAGVVVRRRPAALQARHSSWAFVAGARMFNDDCGRCHQSEFQTVNKFLSWDSKVPLSPIRLAPPVTRGHRTTRRARHPQLR